MHETGQKIVDSFSFSQVKALFKVSFIVLVSKLNYNEGATARQGENSTSREGSKRTTMKMLYTVERMKVSICFRTFTLTVPLLHFFPRRNLSNLDLTLSKRRFSR